MMSDTSAALPIHHTTDRSEDYVDLYANQIRLGATVSDITIVFGIHDDHGVGGTVIKDIAAIRLAPITVKLLFKNLETVLNSYEASVGPIPLPANLTGHLGAQTQLLTAALAALMGGAPQST